MRKVFLGVLTVSLARLIRGQVIILFKPAKVEQVEQWYELSRVLMDAGKMIDSNRIDGYEAYTTRFDDVNQAQAFLASHFGDLEVINEDELRPIKFPA